jgi:hypothetical protein
MGEKLEAGKYANLEEFVDDAQLIFDNCRFYNVEDSMWCKHANKLEKVFKDSLARLRDLRAFAFVVRRSVLLRFIAIFFLSLS